MGSGQGRNDLSRFAELPVCFNPTGGENRRRNRMSDSGAVLVYGEEFQGVRTSAGAKRCHLWMGTTYGNRWRLTGASERIVRIHGKGRLPSKPALVLSYGENGLKSVQYFVVFQWNNGIASACLMGNLLRCGLSGAFFGHLRAANRGRFRTPLAATVHYR